MANDSDGSASISADIESTRAEIIRWSKVLYWVAAGTFLIEAYAIVTGQEETYLPIDGLIFAALIYSAHGRNSRLAAWVIILSGALEAINYPSMKMGIGWFEFFDEILYSEPLKLISFALAVLSLYPAFKLLRYTTRFHRQTQSKIVKYNILHLSVMAILYMVLATVIDEVFLTTIIDDEITRKTISTLLLNGGLFLVCWQKLPGTRNRPVVQHKDSTKNYSPFSSLDKKIAHDIRLTFLHLTEDGRLIVSPMGPIWSRYELPSDLKEEFVEWMESKHKKLTRVLGYFVIPLGFLVGIYLIFEYWRNWVAMVCLAMVLVAVGAAHVSRTKRLFLERFPEAVKIKSSEVKFRYFPKYYFTALVPHPWGGVVLLVIGTILVLTSAVSLLNFGSSWVFYVGGVKGVLLGTFAIWTFVAHRRFKTEHGLPLSLESLVKVTP